MAERKEEEKDAKRNVINITKNIFFQSPIMINAQRKYANMTNERWIASDIHSETIE